MGEACRQEGPAFIPVAAHTLGGLHGVTVDQIKKLGTALARQKGEEGQVEVRHLFKRLSLLLMKGNSSLLLNQVPDGDIDAAVDGTM